MASISLTHFHFHFRCESFCVVAICAKCFNNIYILSAVPTYLLWLFATNFGIRWTAEHFSKFLARRTESNSTQHSLFSFTFKCKCMANKILGQFSYGFRAQCKRMCHGMYVYACVCPFQRQSSGSTMAWDYMKSNRRLRNNLSKAIKKRSETKLCIGWNGPNKQNSVASSRYGCCPRRCPCCVHIFVMYSVVMASHGFAVAGQCPFHSLTHAHTMKERV